MPRLNYVINTNKSFINPYNFIRPDAIVQKGHVPEKNELVTGKLHCKLYVKTPIAILDTDEKNITREKDGHQRYKFIKTVIENREVPCIPGSSIRGCVRSMYEAVTNSCFSTLPENAYLSNRVATNDVYKPALLIRNENGWSIYDAERLSVNTNGKLFRIVYDNGKRKLKSNADIFSFGDCVNVEESNNKISSLKSTKDNPKYVLYIGEPFGVRKHNESVFKKGDVIDVDRAKLNKAINGLEYSIEMYGKKTINKQLGLNKHTGYSSYYDAKKRGVIPVWCKKTTKNGAVTDVSLSMAAIGRKVYKNTVNDLIGQGFISCHAGEKNREKSLCPACQLFGTVKGCGYGSHVRFTDAVCTDEMGEKPTSVTLFELGTPRTGFLPFYAVNGIDYDNNGAKINGRKFYWHNPGAADDSKIYTTQKKTERNSTVEILKKGIFEFDVYFDDISKDQLEALIWTLSLGENKQDGRYCYKIGHGKPLGLGSVKISISDVMIRKIDEGFCYSLQNNSEVVVSERTKLLNSSTKKQVQIISDYDFLRGMDIRYPYIDTDNLPAGVTLGANDAASHKWFSEAKGVRSGERAIILPEITETKAKPLHPYSISRMNYNAHGNTNNNNHGQQRNRNHNSGGNNGNTRHGKSLNKLSK